jgi:hypothetical protein
MQKAGLVELEVNEEQSRLDMIEGCRRRRAGGDEPPRPCGPAAGAAPGSADAPGSAHPGTAADLLRGDRPVEQRG